MCKSVTVATSASKLLTSTAKVATDKAEPQVLVQVAIGTVSVLCTVGGKTRGALLEYVDMRNGGDAGAAEFLNSTCGDSFGSILLKFPNVIARGDFFFPSLDLGLTGGRERVHDSFNNLGDLSQQSKIAE